MSDLKENNSPLSKMYSVFNTLKQKYKTEKSIIVSIDFRQGFIEGYEHQQSVIAELEHELKSCNEHEQRRTDKVKRNLEEMRRGNLRVSWTGLQLTENEYSEAMDILKHTPNNCSRARYEDIERARGILKSREPVFVHELSKRIAELEAGLKQCQVDRDELQEERDRYEKALREIKNDGCDYFEIASAKQYVNRVSEVTDRALNIDDFNASWDE